MWHSEVQPSLCDNGVTPVMSGASAASSQSVISLTFSAVACSTLVCITVGMESGGAQLVCHKCIYIIYRLEKTCSKQTFQCSIIISIAGSHLLMYYYWLPSVSSAAFIPPFSDLFVFFH